MIPRKRNFRCVGRIDNLGFFTLGTEELANLRVGREKLLSLTEKSGGYRMKVIC